MDTTAKKTSKKEVRKQVYEKLANALAEYRSSVKEKKFANKLKKASKLFATDIARAIEKRNKKAKSIAAKKTLKPVQNDKTMQA